MWIIQFGNFIFSNNFSMLLEELIIKNKTVLTVSKSNKNMTINMVRQMAKNLPLKFKYLFIINHLILRLFIYLPNLSK